MKSLQNSQWGTPYTLHQSSNQHDCVEHDKGADAHQIHMLTKSCHLKSGALANPFQWGSSKVAISRR